MPAPSHDALFAALSKVIDPEIRKPVTELGMVESVEVDESGLASVTILLTVSGCPLKETLTNDTTAALLSVEGVTRVKVTLGVMSDEQRTQLRTSLRGGSAGCCVVGEVQVQHPVCRGRAAVFLGPDLRRLQPSQAGELAC